MAAKAQHLGEETWGERLHRAYRRCRALHGITYLAHSEAISEFIPVSDQTIMRFEERDEMPANPRQRQLAYLIVTAYGFCPEEFGLTAETCNFGLWDLPKLKKALDPSRRQQATSSDKKGSAKASDSPKGPQPPKRNNRRTTGVNRGMPQNGAHVSAGQTTRHAA